MRLRVSATPGRDVERLAEGEMGGFCMQFAQSGMVWTARTRSSTGAPISYGQYALTDQIGSVRGGDMDTDYSPIGGVGDDLEKTLSHCHSAGAARNRQGEIGRSGLNVHGFGFRESQTRSDALQIEKHHRRDRLRLERALAPAQRLGGEEDDELRVSGVDHEVHTASLVGKDGQAVAREPNRIAARTGGAEKTPEPKVAGRNLRL